MTPEEISAFKESMIKEGKTSHKILEMKPAIVNKVRNYKFLLFGVNLPLCVGIPVCMEYGILFDKAHAATADKLYLMFTMADFMLFFNSMLIYNTLKTLVSSVEYVPAQPQEGDKMSAEDKLIIK